MLVRLTRMLVYALATAVGVMPLVPLTVAMGAGVGAAIGAFVGGSAAVARVRLSSLLIALLGFAWLSWAGGQALLSIQGFAEVLSPGRALLVATALQACASVFAIALGLRQLALRYRLFGIVEVALVSVAGAQLVRGHRGGAINRPFELADAILAEGGDPTVAFLALGGVIIGLLVLLLIAEGRALRAIFHVGFLLLLFGLFAENLPVPKPPPSPLLRGPQKGERAKRSGGPGSGQRENNEELQFRDNYDSKGRTVPLAVVVLHDDYAPPGGMYYFRQAAFSHFNGRRLVQSSLRGADVDLPTSYASTAVTLPEVPNLLGERIAIDTTVAMLSEHARPFALETLQALTPLQNPDAARFRRVYRATSLASITELPDLLGRAVGDPKWRPEVRDHYGHAPNDKRYAALAAEIVTGLNPELENDPIAQALSVVLWLGDEGTYSLKSGHAKAKDPTADFLFGNRVGYCVHFAHAAVYLMRSLGIPARVGAGYVVDEAARQGGSSILITGQNSHAWPEFYVRDVGWVVADVSPAQALDPAPGIPDPDLQRLLGEMARGLRPLPVHGDNPFVPAIRWARLIGKGLRLAAMWGLPGLLLLLYSIKAYRSQCYLLVGSENRIRKLYRSQLDRLAACSMLRRHGETRHAFAMRVSSQVPTFERMTVLLEESCFGRPEATNGLSRTEARKLAARFRIEMRATASWARRLMCVCDPFSFLRVR